MSNRVQVTLDVKDQGSSVVNRFKSNVQGLGRDFDGLNRNAGKFGGSLTASFAAGQIAASGVLGIVSAISSGLSSAASSISGLFRDYVDIERQGILTAGTISGALDVSFDEARNITRAFTSDLSQQTALYGADLGRIQEAASVGLDDILSTLTSAGETQSEAVKRSAVLFSKLETFSRSDLTNMQLARVLPNLVANELQASKDFFDSEITGYMEKYLESVGATLESSTADQRISALEFALEKKLPDEVAAKMQNTTSGIMAAFRNAFFNIDTGILSFDRDLDGDMSNGLQSVGASFTRLVKHIFGSDGLFASIGGLLQEMGFDDTSVLDAIAGGIGKIGIWAKNTTRFFKDLDGSLLKEDLGVDGKNAVWTLIKKLSGKIWDWANQQATVLASNTMNFLGDIDWFSLGENIGTAFVNSINSLTEKFNNSVSTEDAANNGNSIGVKLGELIFKLFDKIDEQEASEAFGTIMVGAISLAASTIGAFVALSLVDAGKQFVDNSKREITTLFNHIITMINDIGKFVVDQRNNAVGLVNRIPGVNFDTIDYTPVGHIGDSGTGRTGFVTTRFSGTPGFLEALGRAAAIESSRMPSGSEVVIANSSEAVLNRSQQRDLLDMVQAQNQTSSNVNTAPFTMNLGGITVNSYAANAKDVANEVMARLEQMYAQTQQNFITGVV